MKKSRMVVMTKLILIAVLGSTNIQANTKVNCKTYLEEEMIVNQMLMEAIDRDDSKSVLKLMMLLPIDQNVEVCEGKLDSSTMNNIKKV